MALVKPFDQPFNPGDVPQLTRFKDQQLGFTRLRRRVGHVDTTAVVSIESIVRGALIVEDFGCEYGDEYLVVDTVDQDWWLRMKSLRSLNNALKPKRRPNLM